MRNEGTLILMRNFKADFDSGMTIDQIARKYGISPRHTRKLLDEIAKQEGVDREYFLRRPHKKHEITQTPTLPTIVGSKELLKMFDSVDKEMASIMNMIEEMELKLVKFDEKWGAIDNE